MSARVHRTNLLLPTTNPLLIHALLFLALLSIRPAAGLDPATNAGVAACRALAAAAGPQTLPTCHVILAPPLFDYTCNVSVVIEVRTVYGLDESELLEWSGWVQLVWLDPRLAWNHSDGNVAQLKMTRGQMWIPDLGFWNAKEVEFMDLRNAKFSDATVFSNGTVSLYLHTVIRFPCKIDMRLFPFDTQTCKLEFGGITSDRSNFNFTMVSRMSGAQVDSTFYSVGEWQLEQLDQTASRYNMAGQEFGYYSIDFHLRRKPLYYAVLILLPFEMLSLLACVMFFAEEQGDQASISIAIIMSMSLYILIASQSAPKSMNRIPPLGYFLMAQMLVLIFCTFAAVAVHKRVHPERRQRFSASGCAIYLVLSTINSFSFLYLWPALAG